MLRSLNPQSEFRNPQSNMEVQIAFNQVNQDGGEEEALLSNCGH